MAEGGTEPEVPLAVIEIYHLGIGGVITEDDIQGSLAIDVDEYRGIRPIGRLTKSTRARKSTMAVVQQDSADERPMPPLRDDDIEIAITRKVTDGDVR